MERSKMEKRPLKCPTKPMTSASSSQPSISRGDMVFSLQHAKTKVVTFNPLLTPSPLLDPKVMERKQRILAQR
ncbi:hypothetical protein HBI06_057410 [Parastagonospora nodorum]|nr:hypothetical protein HBH52_036800 [Parastagonospora nodorum]KAH4235333.1 hypothetical protein HBI06_057410 [Parastagonospora nodorum]KAH4249760.1 hypothetical protein HBI05_009630 [Parastagonospora nodorum]